jgi:hypothetical protein
MYCTSRSISIYYIFFRMQGITPETGGLQNDNANTLKKKKKYCSAHATRYEYSRIACQNAETPRTCYRKLLGAMFCVDA